MHRVNLLLLLVLGIVFAAHAEDTRDPEALFNQHCFSCHGTGWEGAPVVGDDFAWEERREKGVEGLLQNTVAGFSGMPAKGGCSDCSEAELKAIVEWMIE